MGVGNGSYMKFTTIIYFQLKLTCAKFQAREMATPEVIEFFRFFSYGLSRFAELHLGTPLKMTT